MARPKKQANGTAANIGYEAELWQMADALRGSMDASEYKHVVLGLLFLKYISDAFAARREELRGELAAEDIAGARMESLLESRDAAVRQSAAEALARLEVIGKSAGGREIGRVIADNYGDFYVDGLESGIVCAVTVAAVGYAPQNFDITGDESSNIGVVTLQRSAAK